MSTAQAVHRRAIDPPAIKLCLGFIVVIAAAILLAWFGAQSVRDRTVQVQTVQAGAGPFIQPEDGVIFEYEGRLEDGKLFDSTSGKGPAAMIAGQTIPGFTQALSKMQKGGRYHAHIPAKLAYGANPPAGGPVPPNADLEFDIHILQVVPGAALMQSAPQPQTQQQTQPQQ